MIIECVNHCWHKAIMSLTAVRFECCRCDAAHIIEGDGVALLEVAGGGQ